MSASKSICGLIRDKDVFSNMSAPIELIVLSFLKYLRTFGSNATEIKIVWLLG